MTDSDFLDLLTTAVERVTAEEWVSIPTLAKRYDTTRSTIKNWLYDLTTKGEKIRTCRPSRDWRINRKDFEQAYIKHYSEAYIQ